MPYANGFSDGPRRVRDVIHELAERYRISPLTVLRKVQQTPPEDIIKPLYAVGDLVKTRSLSLFRTMDGSEVQAKPDLIGRITKIIADHQQLEWYIVEFVDGPVVYASEYAIRPADLLTRVAGAASDAS